MASGVGCSHIRSDVCERIVTSLEGRSDCRVVFDCPSVYREQSTAKRSLAYGMRHLHH
jgi:hypothetical protein